MNKTAHKIIAQSPHFCLIPMNNSAAPRMMDEDEAVFQFDLMKQQLCATIHGSPPLPPPLPGQHQNQPALSGPSRPRRNGRRHTVTPYCKPITPGSLGTIPRNPAGTHQQMDANNSPGGSIQRPPSRRMSRTMPTTHNSRLGNRRTPNCMHGLDPGEYAVPMGMSIAQSTLDQLID